VRVAGALLSNEHDVRAFLDSNAKPGQTRYNLPVSSPADWLARNAPCRFIVVIAIANLAYFSELPALYGSLRQSGFPHVVDADEIGSAYSTLWDFFFWHPDFPGVYAARNNALKKYPDRIALGSKSYFSGPPNIASRGNLVIGAYSAIAVNFTCQGRLTHSPNLIMCTHHPLADVGYVNEHTLPEGDIIIGSDVWIGRDVILLSGVCIGDGAVIGAGSVVTRDVLPYSISAGNPARHVRYRFPEPVREALLAIRWWDWPLLELRQIRPLLLSDRIEGLLRYAERREREGFSPCSASDTIAMSETNPAIDHQA
jgi:acetyltransferase-like isoleucine patch superfamily enzyme